MTLRPKSKKFRPKTISVTGVTGQKGVNAIERIVLDMGSRWTASGPNEVGIDGYIELFDPNSRQSLALTVAAQSKVVAAITTDSDNSFAYYPDPNDVAYWLNGNTPVILVVSDGTPQNVYWISVKRYFKDWSPSETARITFDKTKDRFSRDS